MADWLPAVTGKNVLVYGLSVLLSFISLFTIHSTVSAIAYNVYRVTNLSVAGGGFYIAIGSIYVYE
jgi:hypothetical protein